MKIGIYVEIKEGRIPEAQFGPLALAGDHEVFAIVLDAVTSEAYAPLSDHGVNTIVEMVLPHESEISANPVIRAKALVKAAEELGLDCLAGLSNATGRDVLPRAAALLDAPLVMDCVDVDFERLRAKTSQYSGKALATVQVTGSPSIFGIRPNAVMPVVTDGADAANVITLEPEAAEPAGFKILDAAAEVGDPDAPPALAEAEIIIAGGRGLKSKENFDLIFECAKKMKAAVGASRVAVDNEWISYAHQVGQTGEKVSPTVYIACGISGSIQHFAGMKTSRIIIALNQDPDAAMMANCDYAVEGDLFDILPELNRLL